jgi:flagella basal body P-ring formation protein FlgA
VKQIGNDRSAAAKRSGSAVNSLTRVVAAWLLIAIALSALASEPVQDLEAVRAAAHSFALRQASVAPATRVEVEPGRLDPRVRVAPCASALQAFLPPGGRLSGNATVGVRCETAWTLYVPVRVRTLATVLVATRALARAETLRTTDLRSETRDLASLPGPAVGELAHALGRQAAVTIAAGTVLTPRMLQAARLVRRGEKVTILARSGGIEVRATGEALSDGAQGDPIPVRNLLTRKVVQATVAEPGLVQVRL